VDNEKSLEGGRLISFPKELAHFDWENASNGPATITMDNKPICALQYGRRFGSFRVYAGAPSVSIAGDKVMWMRHRFKANYGLCRVRFVIPDDSPLNVVPMGQPIVAIAGTNMTGFMAENQKVLGFLPHRSAQESH
jgi:hypothetical protein